MKTRIICGITVGDLAITSDNVPSQSLVKEYDGFLPLSAGNRIVIIDHIARILNVTFNTKSDLLILGAEYIFVTHKGFEDRVRQALAEGWNRV